MELPSAWHGGSSCISGPRLGCGGDQGDRGSGGLEQLLVEGDSSETLGEGKAALDVKEYLVLGFVGLLKINSSSSANEIVHNS